MRNREEDKIFLGVRYSRTSNEPLYNEVLGITNDFLCPDNSEIYEKEPRHTKPRSSRLSGFELYSRWVPLYCRK